MTNRVLNILAITGGFIFAMVWFVRAENWGMFALTLGLWWCLTERRK